MKHGITATEWHDYLEGQLSDEVHDRIEAHLIGCLSCWEFYEEMAQATGALRSAGDRMRRAFPLQDHELHAGLNRVFARINQSSTEMCATPGVIQQRLSTLAAVLTPMCGAQTAASALRVAAQGSPAQSLEQVTDENWTPFLRRLTSIATVMCGETGAHLVWERGQF